MWPPTVITLRQCGGLLSMIWATLWPAAVLTTAHACGTLPPPDAGRASGMAARLTNRLSLPHIIALYTLDRECLVVSRV